MPCLRARKRAKTLWETLAFEQPPPPQLFYARAGHFSRAEVPCLTRTVMRLSSTFLRRLKFFWWCAVSREAALLPHGELVVGKEAPGPLLDSLLYTLSYHRFGQLHASATRVGGFDRVRREEIGRKEVALSYFQEVYTTTNWLVRVYKVRRCSLPRADTKMRTSCRDAFQFRGVGLRRSITHTSCCEHAAECLPSRARVLAVCR